MSLTILGLERSPIGRTSQCQFADGHPCGFFAWQIRHTPEEPVTDLCTHHLAGYIEPTTEGVATFIPKVLALTDLDPRCSAALIDVVRRLLRDGEHDDLADTLMSTWRDVEHFNGPRDRMPQARLLIGSVVFALLAPAPVASDDDLCEAGR